VATPQVRADLPIPELKLLYAESANRCAFPHCGQLLAMTDQASGRAVVVGEAAHIVASQRQGPRGRFPISDEERDRRASNRVLLCPTHHTTVDRQPLVYTVEVLRQMKADHQARHAPAPASRPELASLETERLQSSLLPVLGLPVVVASASLRDSSLSEGEAARLLRYPKGSRGIVFPFIIRENRLWSFSRLRENAHPFADVVDGDVEEIATVELAASDEGHRRVVALLNRSLGRQLAMRGVRFDREHQRYWAMADRDPEGILRERPYQYETKGGRRLTRNIVHHAHKRSGEPKEEWYHEAARLRFERFEAAWFLSVRPEFHLTLDGETPMPSHRVGRKITRKKSHLYNDGYLDRLWFWKHFLTEGGPRVAIKTGEQTILIDGAFASTSVTWPGVPGDSLVVKSERAAETLFSVEDLDDDTDDDEEWWDEDEEDDQ